MKLPRKKLYNRLIVLILKTPWYLSRRSFTAKIDRIVSTKFVGSVDAAGYRTSVEFEAKFPTRKNLAFALDGTSRSLLRAAPSPISDALARYTRRVSARSKEAHTCLLETSTRRKAEKLLFSRDGPISPVRLTRGLRLYQVSEKLEILCEIVSGFCSKFETRRCSGLDF